MLGKFIASLWECLVRGGTNGALASGPSSPGPSRVESLERRQLLAASPVIFKADFEAANDFSRFWTKDLFDTGTITTSSTSEPSRSGSRSAKFTLPAHNQRSELTLTPDPAGADRWYTESIFIPTDWVPDSFRVIVAQWHEEPDFDLGETWRIPPLYLSLLGSRWNAESRFDTRAVNADSLNARPPFGGTTTYDLGAFQTGVWTDWVFHVKWSYKSDGLLDIWQNGKQVVHQVGPNTYNDESGNYFKTGIYQPDYKLATNPVAPVKTLYIDEVREATGAATYADVAPGQPIASTAGTLTVQGGSGNDSIRITQSGTTLTVNKNGVVSTLSTSGATRLVVNGLAGDDKLFIDRTVTLPTLLDGGPGKDTLHGGQGRTEYYGGPDSDAVDFSDATSGLSISLDNAPNDGPAGGTNNVHDDVEAVLGGRGNDTLVGSFFSNVIVGNGGNDTIRDGGGGRDLMIGGDGADSLAGNGSDDLLIAGRTAYDASFFSLLALRGAWGSSGGSYATRISQLKAGISGVKVASSTVFNDSAIDTLLGGTASDWFVINAGDIVKDRSANETVTTL